MKYVLSRGKYAGYTLTYCGKPQFNTVTAKAGKACHLCPNRLQKLLGFMDCFVCRHEHKGNKNQVICQDMIPIRRRHPNNLYPEPKENIGVVYG